MRKILLTQLVLTGQLLCFGSAAWADDDAREALIDRLEAPTTLSANFEQRTFTENQSSVAISTGQMRIAKPMRFAWQVFAPFEQQVVSDGETLWVYDPDLEQATYQPVGTSVQQSPAMILSQPRKVLTEQYEVIEASTETLAVYRLFPIDTSSVFTELTVAFKQDLIAEIRILDSLGQETIIALTEVIANAPLDDEMFSFNPPPGTDLFEQL
ncbi:outer membrane lipoprotein chaperone LolA [Reinekea sp.]|jgi:outer membrane lipoprotein carrier protein|uniref:outer membrane lipoprotein chaperone LolA n=1 Tax=Reinekea sp. TaxID=1970455 RepID=UPI002A7EB6F7|nr:outer membrane lipoprotein chaperone LolA [Reinekea sp.]